MNTIEKDSMNKQKLLSINSDPKTTKGNKYNYSTAILYLASAKQSGYNVCPQSSPQCENDCLFWAGRGRMKTTQNARIKKTKYYIENRIDFMIQLIHEIDLFIKRSKKNNVIPTIRLNGTSDIPFENFKYHNGLNIMENFPQVQYYDYTVTFKRMTKFMNDQMPKNYHLTYSRKENNQKEVLKVLENNFNVSVVYENKLPNTFCGFKVINGDDTDLRFLDNHKFYNDLKYPECYSGGLVVGLKYKKSKAQKIDDSNNFIIQTL